MRNLTASNWKFSRWVPGTLRDRFEEKSIPEPNSGCFLWLGAVARKGYGQMRVDGKTRTATHIALELEGRPVPIGMCVLHRCDTPACVNAAHLFVGTAAENTADMRSKGRERNPPVLRGSANWKTSLTEIEALEIRRRLDAGATQRGLARELGHSLTVIHGIAKRRTWNHV